MIKVFFDTNVIIDAFTSRDYDYRNSQRLVLKAINKEIDGYISSKQITDIYYILRKYLDDEQKKRTIIKDITESFNVLPLLPSDISLGLKSNLPDYEDAILEEAASVYSIPFIVTHNVKHFKNARAIIFAPEDLIKYIDSGSFK